MNNNKTNYKHKFQHFSFHLIARYQRLIGVNFYLNSFNYFGLGENKFRILFSSCKKKRPLNLNEPLNSIKKSPLSNNEGSPLTDTNSDSLIKHKGGIAANPKVCNGSENVKISILERFILKIKNYYRRSVIGVKKGYSINSLPPETLSLVGLSLIRLFNVLGIFVCVFCISKTLFYFNIYIQYAMVIIYTFFYGLFLLYFSIVRLRYTNKFIKNGYFEVSNSPLNHYSYRIANFIGRYRALL